MSIRNYIMELSKTEGDVAIITKNFTIAYSDGKFYQINGKNRITGMVLDYLEDIDEDETHDLKEKKVNVSVEFEV